MIIISIIMKTGAPQRLPGAGVRRGPRRRRGRGAQGRRLDLMIIIDNMYDYDYVY